ncbi:MAG: phenylalanine--tRNA ligase subunit beta [Armatimonadota bacterium]|nr:phenylalanine--tRNA ligase subunit beta [Fimbriimonadaceae bacterium]MCZ8139461.1 phenylalanine--tRNA ligase subunit beta [Fimbriimonadaceae bacterium]
MKLPVSVLKDYVKTDLSAEALGDLLTMTGFELEEILEINGEPVLDVNIMANRGDGASILGLAREILAKDPAAEPTELLSRLMADTPRRDRDNRDIWSQTNIKIESQACSQYALRLFPEVTNGPSPEWLQQRLELLGQRPVSLLVDLTNYVMFELGQPLHAFDAALVRGQRIVVREAEAGERMTTLDEIERELEPGMLLICDGEGPVAVAGVMGGSTTEVNETTTSCLLESAHFDNQSVRRTRKRLGLQTEASYRFERSVDPEGVVRALDRFADLLEEITGAKPVGGAAQVVNFTYQPAELDLSLPRCRALLGVPVTISEAADALMGLGFSVTARPEEDCLWVGAPSWRFDIAREEDLIEEVGRIYGYERIPEWPVAGSNGIGGAHGYEGWQDRVREAALRAGLDQCLSHTLRKAHELDAASDLVPLLNPHSPEHAVLRNSLLPGLAEAALRNGGQDLRLFEMGRVFTDATERAQLAILMTGQGRGPDWRKDGAPAADFFDLKGVLEAVARHAARPLDLEPLDGADGRFHPTRSARWSGGVMGQIHPQWATATGLPAQTFLAEIDLEAWYGTALPEAPYTTIHRHPATRRDISVLVSQDLPYAQIEAAARAAAGEWLETMWLFDVYEGDRLPAGTRSLAIALQLRKGGNFTDEEANQVRDRVVAALEGLGAQLRS